MSDIRYKLTHHELFALSGHLEHCLQNNDTISRDEKLVHTVMLRFYKKIKNKALILDSRPYKITVEYETALAFVIFFGNTPLSITSFVGNLIQKMIAEFDQQTSKPIISWAHK